MNELQARLGPLPLWGWLVAGVALGGAALLFWRRKGGTSGVTLGQSQQNGPQPNYNYSSLDPLTGVPYSVESQVNPNTGLPNYYNSPSPVAPPPASTPPPVTTPPASTTPPIVPVGPSGGVNPPGPIATPTPIVTKTAPTPPPYPTPSVSWPNYPGTITPAPVLTGGGGYRM